MSLLSDLKKESASRHSLLHHSGTIQHNNKRLDLEYHTVSDGRCKIVKELTNCFFKNIIHPTSIILGPTFCDANKGATTTLLLLVVYLISVYIFIRIDGVEIMLASFVRSSIRWNISLLFFSASIQAKRDT